MMQSAKQGQIQASEPFFALMAGTDVEFGPQTTVQVKGLGIQRVRTLVCE